MEELASLVLTVSAVILSISWLLLWLIKKRRIGSPPLPPGPRGLPLIGSLPFLEPDLHRYFAKLSKVYGPIMKVRLGNKFCIVLGSSSAAKEVLKDNDLTFANRDPSVVALIASYGGMDLVWAPYGQQWRMLRKVCVGELMSRKSLDACFALRRREVRRMVRDIRAKVGSPINIAEQIYATIFGAITSMLWGNTAKGEEEFNCIDTEFRLVLEEVVQIYEKPDISDLFPVLALFDVQGLTRRIKRCSLSVDRILDTIIDGKQREGSSSSKGSTDFLQILLQIKEQRDPKMPLTTTHIKALFLVNLLSK